MVNADKGDQIRIVKDIHIGPNVVFRARNHVFGKRDTIIRQQGHNPGRIMVGDNVWIGANAVILSNVDMGTGAVIGAGSIVNKDVASYTIVVGVPAEQIGSRG